MEVLRRFGSLVLVGLALSCATTTTEIQIPRPSVLFRSPSLNFERIKMLCLFPVQNIGMEVPELSSGMDTGIYQLTTALYPDWRVISGVDLLQRINQYGLGRGYQNYSADLSTFAQVGWATPAFSKETKSFFKDIQKNFGCDAFLFTQYNYYPNDEVVVRSILYSIPEERAWWIAMVRLNIFLKNTSPSQMASLLSQSIAQNLGKGTLRQL